MRRYLFVGVSVYLLELIVIFIAQTAGLPALIAVGLSFWIGLIVSFLLQKFVTFGDHRRQHKVVAMQLLAVTLLVLLNFGFTLLVTSLTAPWIPAFLSRTIALGITTLWNFYLYKTHIFRSQEPPLA